MINESDLQRLSEGVIPSDALKLRVKARMQQQIRPEALLRTVEKLKPAKALTLSLKERILQAIAPAPAHELSHVADGVYADTSAFARMKHTVLSSLRPIPDPAISIGFKWAAAFAVFVLVIRTMPIVFLPATSAEAGVQLIPSGSVSVSVGGVWKTVDQPEVLRGPVMIRTEEGAKATLIFNDDGVFRLGSSTTLRVHNVFDHQTASDGPTAGLVRGEVWALGLVPPFTDGLSIQTSGGRIAVNAGSVSIKDDGTVTTVAVYDRGATLQKGAQTVFLVTGEKVSVKGDAPLTIASMPTSAFTDGSVSANLAQDAVHRTEIAKLQSERRLEMAGILPTSILYSAKRLAEEVDVLFTVTRDGRAEKRLEQANTRLSEALTLIKEGQGEEAQAPLTEYKQSLVAMAGDENDSLVKYFVQKHIADASVDIGTDTEESNDPGSVELLKQAIADIDAALPNADLKPKDIEGYMLVDTLAQMHHDFALHKDPAAAAAAYAEVSPYLKELLDEKQGAHPLLQKEAKALLVSTSALFKDAGTSDDEILIALETDISQYLPEEQEAILLSEEQLNAEIQKILDRILLFRHPRSRYNQLLAEIAMIIEKHPDDVGVWLRRLKTTLPDGLGEYVNTAIQKLGDELKSEM